MSELNAFWLCLGLLLGLVVGVFVPEVIEYFPHKRICTTKTDAEYAIRDHVSDEQGPKRAEFAPDFAVTGKPRAIPWHIRRKELEAAARTKRKRLESFQEYV